MSSQIKIGVFIPSAAQALDVATVDVLATISKEYFTEAAFLPAHLTAAAPDVSVFFITTPEQGPDIKLTAGMVLRSTHVYTDAEVAPGKLDVIVVPGSAPTANFVEGGLKWLRESFETGRVDVLSVCTGLYICASAGIADGKSVSGPRDLQDDLMKTFPKIKLVGDKQRWVKDGNLWSSGGVTNGNDLMAAYARQGRHWSNQELVETGLALTEVGDRDQFYGPAKDKAT